MRPKMFMLPTETMSFFSEYIISMILLGRFMQQLHMYPVLILICYTRFNVNYSQGPVGL